MAPFFLRSLTIFVLLSFSLLSVGAHAETVAIDEADPPYAYDSSNGPAGVVAALTREAFRRAGEPLELRSLPRKRILMSMGGGIRGATGVAATPERLEKFDLSTPLIEVPVYVYTRRGRTFPLTGADSLIDKRVGAARGRWFGSDFERLRDDGRVKVEEENGDAPNIEKLLSNRIDAALLSPAAADIIFAVTNAGGRVTALDTPLVILPLHIVFAKSANKSDLVSRLDVALEAMRSDGTSAAIVGALGTR